MARELLDLAAVIRRDAWTPATPPRASSSRENTTDERATIVLSGEITAPRAWPRNESPELSIETFGDYYVHEQLGIGGMASVHRAERRLGGARQRVALKRMLPHAAADSELVRLFLDEAQLVALLHHRNIAEVYDFGSVDGEYFLAMELVAGPTLKHLLRHCEATVGLIPYPLAVNLLIQVCDALAYAHDVCDERGKPVGLVHRDVSPSNIVISSNGVVKLIDFGIAKTKTTHTQAGIIKGKLGYIAPEYLEDSGIDRRADLWAVGVIAYELLTGQRLFTADDDLELMSQVRVGAIVPPSFHNADVPPELEAVVLTALERDPARRWQNATALRNALASVVRASTNAEIMEWVEFVFKVADSDLRPVRGTRQQPVMTSTLLDADPVLPQLPGVPVRAATPLSFSSKSLLSIPALPPPPSLKPSAPTVTLRPVRSQEPAKPLATYTSSIGAAMISRSAARRRISRVLLPLFLILLGGIASAIAIPILYEMISRAP